MQLSFPKDSGVPLVPTFLVQNVSLRNCMTSSFQINTYSFLVVQKNRALLVLFMWSILCSGMYLKGALRLSPLLATWICLDLPTPDENFTSVSENSKLLCNIRSANSSNIDPRRFRRIDPEATGSLFHTLRSCFYNLTMTGDCLTCQHLYKRRYGKTRPIVSGSNISSSSQTFSFPRGGSSKANFVQMSSPGGGHQTR